MDSAASEFFKDGKYDLDFKNKDSDGSYQITAAELQEVYARFAKDFPVISIEVDPSNCLLFPVPCHLCVYI